MGYTREKSRGSYCVPGCSVIAGKWQVLLLGHSLCQTCIQYMQMKSISNRFYRRFHDYRSFYQPCRSRFVRSSDLTNPDIGMSFSRKQSDSHIYQPLPSLFCHTISLLVSHRVDHLSSYICKSHDLLKDIFPSTFQFASSELHKTGIGLKNNYVKIGYIPSNL